MFVFKAAVTQKNRSCFQRWSMLLGLGTKISFDLYQRPSNFLWGFNSQGLGPTMDVGAEHGFTQDLRAQLQIHDFENSALKCCLTLQLPKLHNVSGFNFYVPKQMKFCHCSFPGWHLSWLIWPFCCPIYANTPDEAQDW